MDGNEEFGPDHVQHDPELVLGGVSGDVDGLLLFVDHLAAAGKQPVDGVAHRLFVPRDGGGEDGHHILLRQGDHPVLSTAHEDKAGEGFSLAARGHDHQRTGRDFGNVLDVHDGLLVGVKVAQLPGELHVLHHAPPHQGDLPVEPGRRVHHLLHPMEVAGEGGNDDAPRPVLPEEPVDGAGQSVLRLGETGALHIGGVRQQKEDALLPFLREGGIIGQPAVDGGGVELEVSGVDHGPHGSLDGQGETVGDGMAHGDEPYREGAHLHPLSRPHLPVVGGEGGGPLGELVPHHAEGELRPVERSGDFREDEGKPPDMVFVAVGDDDAHDLLFSLFKIGDVGDDEVNAEHLVVGEHEPAVHDENRIVVLEGKHVFPHFPQAAQGYIPQLPVLLRGGGFLLAAS